MLLLTMAWPVQITHTARARKCTHTHTCPPKAHYIRFSVHTTRTSSRECALIRFGYGEIESKKAPSCWCVGSSSAAAASIFLRVLQSFDAASNSSRVLRRSRHNRRNTQFRISLIYMFVEAILRACRKIPKRARTNVLSESPSRALSLSSHKFINIFVSVFSHTSFFLLASFFRFLFRLSECWLHPPPPASFTHLLYPPPERKARFTLHSFSLSGTSFRECPDVLSDFFVVVVFILWLCCTQPHTLTH